MEREPALCVKQQSGILLGLLNLHDVHEPSWEPRIIIKDVKKRNSTQNFIFLLWVGADLAVNLDQPLLQDGLDLLGGQSVLQTVPGKKEKLILLTYLIITFIVTTLCNL